MDCRISCARWAWSVQADILVHLTRFLLQEAATTICMEADSHEPSTCGRCYDTGPHLGKGVGYLSLLYVSVLATK